jgi:hypothetical protein
MRLLCPPLAEPGVLRQLRLGALIGVLSSSGRPKTSPPQSGLGHLGASPYQIQTLLT